MSLVKVKGKYQVTLPASVRAKARIGIGDILEATVEKGKITLVPKTLIDREIALALEEAKRGRVYGPFKTAGAAIRALRRSSR